MIYAVLKIVLFVLVFILGIELGAGAIEYDRVEKDVKQYKDKEVKDE